MENKVYGIRLLGAVLDRDSFRENPGLLDPFDIKKVIQTARFDHRASGSATST